MVCKNLIKSFFFLGVFVVSVVSFARAESIKIAYVEPLSGPMANVGDIGLKHFRYKAEQMNKRGGILGREVEIVAFDNKASPQESLVILRQIADQGISYIAQGQGSHVAAALISGLEKHNQRNSSKVLYLNYAALDPALTEDQCSFWHFRFDAHSEIKLEVLTNYITRSSEVKKVFLINQDYAHGHQVSKISKRLISQKSSNIEVVGDALHPIGRVKDFSPYIAQIKASGADTVITGNWGNDLALLVKAAADANLDAKFYTFFGGGLGTPAMIGKAGEGRVFQVSEYHRNLPLEKNKLETYDFSLPFDERFAPVDWYFERVGTMLDMLKIAIERAETTEATKVAFTLEDMSIETPWGAAHLRGFDHQLLQPLFISMLTNDVKYDAEKSGLGMKTVAEVPADETATASSCVMRRPKRL